MRRCPECSFIYEDDQRLCDMDGTALVHDADLPPVQANVESKPASLQNSRARRLVVSTTAAVVLVAVLFAVYYFITRREPPQKSSPASAPSINQSSTTSTTAQQATPDDVSVHERDEVLVSSANTSPVPAKAQEKDPKTLKRPVASRDHRLTISGEIPPLPRVKPLRRLPPAQVEEKKPASASATQQVAVVQNQKVAVVQKKPASDNKRASRVASLLKKTGRVLTKPFRF